MAEVEVGIVDHWFGHIHVAGIKITSGVLKVGDTIHIKGHTSDFQQTIESMQIEHENVTEAKKEDVIGIKVASEGEKVRVHDKVYKVMPE